MVLESDVASSFMSMSDSGASRADIGSYMETLIGLTSQSKCTAATSNTTSKNKRCIGQARCHT